MARTRTRMDETLRRWFWTATFMAAFIGAGSSGRCDGAAMGTAVLVAQGVGWSEPRLVLLAAGTRIGDTPPEGWTHSVLRSMPRLKSGDLDTLPTAATKTATMFRTAILAD